jgi:hypothetical protein
MAVFASPVLDGFNRADENPIAAPWEGRGGVPLRLASNQLAGAPSGNAARYGAYLPAGALASCEAYATVKALDGPATGSQVGVYAHIQPGLPADAMTGYGFVFHPNFQFSGDNTLYLAPTGGVIRVSGFPLQVDDKLGLRVISGSLQGWIWRAGTWTLMLSGAPSVTYPPGYLGARVDGNLWRLDDFGGGALTPADMPSMVGDRLSVFGSKRVVGGNLQSKSLVPLLVRRGWPDPKSTGGGSARPAVGQLWPNGSNA